MNKKEFIKEEKDCADMLGMNIEEYRKYVQDIKIPTKQSKKEKYDNSILEKLGLSIADLKKRRVNVTH